jgi:trans-aconitate 2-methyltransferase
VSDTVESLILDLLEWIGPDSRPYEEVLETWRTSCPRLPVWEDAKDRGLVASRHKVGRGLFISVSDSGRDLLRERRPSSVLMFASPSVQDSLGDAPSPMV